METVLDWVFVGSKERSEAPEGGDRQRPRSRRGKLDYMSHGTVLAGQHPIHKNLSTSFTDLSALIRHLRGLQFVGRVQIELSSYEAEIELSEGGGVSAREQDHIAGRLSFGQDALQRIMIRAKQPGGLIHVFRQLSVGSERVFVDEVISVGARRMAAGNGSKDDTILSKSIVENPIPKPESQFDPACVDNWTELLALVSELMQTIDGSLAKGTLQFSEAFRNACGFVSFDYPFLDPDSDVFAYRDGYISLRQRLAPDELIAGIFAAIARIMNRLREDPYFGNVHHMTMHRLRVLANRRRLQFETFGLGQRLQKITGI